MIDSGTIIVRCGTVTTWPFDELPLHARWSVTYGGWNDPDPYAYKRRIELDREFDSLHLEIEALGIALREAMHRIATLPENTVPPTNDPKPLPFILRIARRFGPREKHNRGTLRNFCKCQ